MTLEDLADQFNAARNETERLQALKSFVTSRASRPKAPLDGMMTNTEFYAELDGSRKSKRESLMQLRYHHLEEIDRTAKRPDFDRSSYHEFMVKNYDSLFGPLRRPKAKEVPSDQFRKFWMVGMLLDRIEERRAYFKRRNLI
jgi:hypothetical protein